MKSLRNHFTGEVNSTSNISGAKRLHNYVHNKNESSVVFELFLSKLQKMYNIFEEEGDPMEEDAIIRFLFKRVEHLDPQK